MINDVNCLYMTGNGFVAKIVDVPGNLDDRQFSELLKLSGYDIRTWCRFINWRGDGSTTGLTQFEESKTYPYYQTVFEGTWTNFVLTFMQDYNNCRLGDGDFQQ